MMLRKSFWMLRGKPVQSVLHILLMVIIASTLLVGIIFKETGEFITSGGTFYYSIRVTSKNPDGIIPQDTIEKLADNPDIAGYNYYITKEIQPANFENWVEYYKDESQSKKPPILSINLDIHFSEIFSNNTAELVEGDFPTESKHGVMIEQSMAEYNKIQIGDSIQFEITENSVSQLINLKVIGIYRLNSPLQVQNDINCQTGYAISPYTIIYTDFYTMKSVQFDIAISYIDFYTQQMKSIPLILSNFNDEMDEDLEANDSTDTMFIVLNLAVDRMSKYYNWMIYLLILTSLIMSILFSVYTQHKNIYETAVLSILGASKNKILLQNVLNAFLLSSVSNAISAIIAVAFSNSIGLYWLSIATQDYELGVNNFSFGAEHAALIHNYAVDNLGLKILSITIVIFFISIFTAVIYSLSVLRLTPHKRMAKVS